MKHSVFTVALDDLTYQELAPILAEEGYDGVEWRVTHPDEEAEMRHLNLHNIEEQAENVKGLCDDLGLDIPALASYETMDKTDRIERLFKLAGLIGAPMVRVWPRLYDRNPHFDDRYRDIIDDLRRTVAMAKDYGLKVTLELHMGTIFPGASDARRIVDNFSPDEVGITFDPGNMVIEGWIEWALCLQILGPYLANVHVKNIGWKQRHDGSWHWKWWPLFGGMVDWSKVIYCLKEIGYDGYLAQEDFSSFRQEMKTYTPDKKAERIEYVRKTLRDNKAYIDELINNE